MRPSPAVALLLLCSACSSAPAWTPIPKPWTPAVIDVQRRVRVVPSEGAPFEVERPQYEPEGRSVLAWRGTGPDDRYPARSLPLEQVTGILGITPGDPNYGGNRLAQASLVTIGVVLWGLILVAIFV
ncbi:MAG: hypothetical protein NTY35_10730 [Planctomycetota bacterium]|nr:hypothetical protein [Planctomycetota bacterium]